VWVTDAETPPGMRVYAIGDVHGCIRPLSVLHDQIARDLADHPTDDWRIVHIGDYVDRGPDSRAVLDFLALRAAQDPRVICLLGNHDAMMVDALNGEKRMRQTWLQNGGAETLASYGLGVPDFVERLSARAGFDDAIPTTHTDFIEDMATSVQIGDYYFVHAGIDPDTPLEAQEPEAQLWIRDRFLRHAREYDAVIVHGHTPTRRVEIRANRIGIDTGAVYGGELTCLILDGKRKARLGEGGRKPLV